MFGNYSKQKFPKKKNDKLDIVDTVEKSKNQVEVNGTLTTLFHVLVPLAALTILWGRQGFITRVFLQFKKNCISALRPSVNNNSVFLQYLGSCLLSNWFAQVTPLEGNAKEFWRDGSLMCFLINTAIPGACCNPQQHWNERPAHGQILAYKYLGVTPVFTADELRDQYLSSRKEQKFAHYLLRVQNSVHKISKREIKFSSRYLARGMGLVTGEQFKKSVFYIYSNYSALTKGDLIVSICGPFGTHCTATIPGSYTKKLIKKQDLAYVTKAQRLLFRSFSIDLGSIMNSERKPVIGDDIPIKIETEEERVKVVFIPQVAGMHEISIVTNGFHLVGSPYLSNVSSKSTYLAESLDCNGGKINYKRIKKKIISKFIDCIDEQINLYNGASNLIGSEVNLEPARLSTNGDSEPLPLIENELFHQNNGLTTDSLEDNGVHMRQNELIINSTNCPQFLHNTNEQIDNSSGFNCSQDAVDEMSLERCKISDSVIRSLKTSPICESHIDPEVNGKTDTPPVNSRSAVKLRVVNRQSAFDDLNGPRTESTEDLSNQDIEKQFEALLENNYDDYQKYSAYVDCYITELDTKTDLISTKFDTFEDNNLVGETYPYMHWTGRSYSSIRRSLPNISSVSNCNQISTTDFRTQFKQRQGYWKMLSSRTLSCLSQSSSPGAPRGNPDITRYTKINAVSMPDLSSLRGRILMESNDNTDFPSDFYSTQQAYDFRSKFLQHRTYWEMLSRQNFSDSIDIISENDFDSGYYASLPNLSPDIENGSKIFKQFRERRQFWEQLSMDDTKWALNQNEKTKKVDNKSLEVENAFETSLKNAVDTISEYEEDEYWHRKTVLNLTDDLKQVDSMRIQYSEARDFFRSLESVQTQREFKCCQT